MTVVTHYGPRESYGTPTPPKPQPSQDADRILALRSIHHPALAALTRELAENGATLDEAKTRITAEAARLHITVLDLEMAQPGAACRVPFAPTDQARPEGGFQAEVSAHVRTMLEAGHVPRR